MEIRAYTTNTKTHRTVVRGVELDKLVAEAVASKAGIDLNADHVDFKVWIKRDGNGLSSSEPVAEVEIIEDFSKLPTQATP